MADKLIERAAELDERAEKLIEREAKLIERESKLIEREEQLNGMPGGWPFPSSMFPTSSLGGIFVAAYITPVAGLPRAGTAPAADARFQALGAKFLQNVSSGGAKPAGGQEQVAAPKVYKEPRPK
jgi:hypothetical protein